MDNRYDQQWIVNFANNENWDKCFDILPTRKQAIFWGKVIMEEDKKADNEEQELTQHEYFTIGQILVDQLTKTKFVIVNKEKIYINKKTEIQK
jgi:hypothetical protein